MSVSFNGIGIIFDLDGTLIDTADDLAASMNHVLVETGRAPIDPSSVRSLVGFGAKALINKGIERSAGETIDDKEMERCVEIFLRHYLANIAVASRPFPKALEAINQLSKAGARIAVCTNKQEGPACQLIEQLGLSHLFDVIVGSDTTIAAKPDPAPVRLCMEKMAVDRAVFVGDSDTDINAAIAADLPCLLHENGYGPATKKALSQGSFDNYNDFPALAAKVLNLA